MYSLVGLVDPARGGRAGPSRPRALKGESGVYTHNSVRFDKIDITPQPKMIAMLKSL